MAIDQCKACQPCITQLALGNQSFKQQVLLALCALVSGEVTFPAAEQIPSLSMGFGSITAAYVDTTFLGVDGDAIYVRVANTTNRDIQLSFDGGITEGPIVPLGTVREFNFREMGISLSGVELDIKYINGVAPTTGAVLFDGFRTA